MASGENARTWACVQCTYLNYHKATKCAICQRPRLIEDDLVVVKVRFHHRYVCDENVAQDGRLSSPAPSTSTTRDSDKWACRLCTYLNYPKTQRCATCRTPRHESVASTSATVTLPVAYLFISSNSTETHLASTARRATRTNARSTDGINVGVKRRRLGAVLSSAKTQSMVVCRGK